MPRKSRDEKDLAEIETRLNRGWRMIDEESRPAHVERLIEHWLTLLAEYERIYDELNIQRRLV